ncbi:MAG: CHAP domain-containing protein, partial [Oscillospiraceae bacterium]|nr:CHAP domain-containing protein [Oscillospiraceae bacterium]
FGKSRSQIDRITDDMGKSSITRKGIADSESTYLLKKYNDTSKKLESGVSQSLLTINTDISTTSESIKEDTEAKWNDIYTFLNGKFTDILTSATTNFTNVKVQEQTNFKAANNDISSKTGNMYTVSSGNFHNIANSARTNFSSMHSYESQDFASASKDVSKNSSDMYSNASSKFKGIASAASQYFSAVSSSAHSGMSSADSSVYQYSKSINNNVADKIGGAINGVISGINFVLSAVGSGTKIKPISIKKYAYGSGYHMGGPAVVNDQQGSTYRELVQLPNGKSFIPEGRNVLIPDLPAGSSVLPASQTKRAFPHYANGVGDFFGTPKGIMDSLSDKIWDYLDDPKKILQAAVDKFTKKLKINQPWMDMETGTVKYLTSKSINFIKHQLEMMMLNGSGTLEAFMKVAESEVGYLEKASNSGLDSKTANAGHADFSKYARDFGMNGVAWCDLFVSWCLKKAGVPEQLSASVEQTMNHYKSEKRWTGNPARGDLIFYDWDRNGTGDHIGIVESVTKGIVNTIEGNTSGPNGFEGVFRKHRNLNSGNVLGFGQPKFTSGGGTAVVNGVSHKLDASVEKWRGVAAQALMLTHQYTPANLSALLYQMQTESDGNPNDTNNWDINAMRGDPSRGLMQVIGSTFKEYAISGHNSNIFDPLSNIVASIRYTLARYGSLLNGWSGHAYANGIGKINWGGWRREGGIFDKPTLIGIGDTREAALP